MDQEIARSRTAHATLDRRVAVQRLLRDRGDILVVSGLGSATYDVYAAGENDANFYLWGAMGGAALVGLGLALAQPTRPIAVLTGDGEQLMGLGGLATIAAKRPPNLSIVVLDNGHFGETGMQVSHSGLGVDLHKVAAAVGFAWSLEVCDMDGIDVLSRQLHKTTGGPRFATVRIGSHEVERTFPPRDGVSVKNKFRGHLGLSIA